MFSYFVRHSDVWSKMHTNKLSFQKCFIRNLSYHSFLSVQKNIISYKKNNALSSDYSFINSKFKYSTDDSKTSDEPKDKPNKFIQFFSENKGVIFLAGASFFLFSIIYGYGAPSYDENNNEILDDYSSSPVIVAYPLRAYYNIKHFKQTICDPISDKLLPSPEPNRMTLVLESNGVLLNSEWSHDKGWVFKKRPGLDFFLETVSKYYEVVIFTSDVGMQMEPVFKQLDPEFKKLHYRLYRECTRYNNWTHIKDLSNLNRNLEKIIRIDWEKEACQLQPRNTLLLKKWKGDDQDRELIDLAAFLKMMVDFNLKDVREGLDLYSKYSDPLSEFRIRCKNLEDHVKKRQKTPKPLNN